MSPQPLDYRPRGADQTGATPGLACLHCGGTDLVEGSVQSGVPVRFVPKRVESFWTFNNGVATSTYACRSCGAVVTVLEPDDVRRLIGGRRRAGNDQVCGFTSRCTDQPAAVIVT